MVADILNSDGYLAAMCLMLLFGLLICVHRTITRGWGWWRPVLDTDLICRAIDQASEQLGSAVPISVEPPAPGLPHPGAGSSRDSAAAHGVESQPAPRTPSAGRLLGAGAKPLPAVESRGLPPRTRNTGGGQGHTHPVGVGTPDPAPTGAAPQDHVVAVERQPTAAAPRSAA